MLNFNEYKIKGFQIAKGLFDPKIIDIVRKEAQEIFLRQMKQVGYDVNQIASEADFNQYLFRLFNEFPHLIISSGKHIQHLISLHRLSLDEKIINGLKELGIKTPNICTRPVLFFNTKKLAKKQVYWKTDAHQDWRSMQGSLNSMVVWLPLCDVDTSLGALEVIPGSHLNGLQSTEMVDSFGLIPESKLEREKFIAVELKRGDALFFSSFLYHQSGDNSTENDIRWSCHFRYNDMDEPDFIERGFPHPYVYYPNPDLITPSYPPEGRLVSYFE